ncbi:MAG: AAA family ATPase [Pseudomonadales bacterium]
MTFLKEITFKDTAQIPAGFPFTIPIIESLDRLTFDTPVTFFVGENGSGKSTLIEAIAPGMNCPSLGTIEAGQDPLLSDARKLAAQLAQPGANGMHYFSFDDRDRCTTSTSVLRNDSPPANLHCIFIIIFQLLTDKEIGVVHAYTIDFQLAGGIVFDPPASGPQPGQLSNGRTPQE